MKFFVVMEMLKILVELEQLRINNMSKSNDSLHKLISQTRNKLTFLSEKLFSKMVEKCNILSHNYLDHPHLVKANQNFRQTVYLFLMTPKGMV